MLCGRAESPLLTGSSPLRSDSIKYAAVQSGLRVVVMFVGVSEQSALLPIR
jgi:hypothetical protein